VNQIILIGPALSSYVRTARICCEEKGVSHELQPVELRSDAHRKLHPWAKVPIMRHGDLQLIETSAICRYVDAAFAGPRLVPDDARAAAIMEQWVSATSCYLYDDLIRNYALQYIFPAMRGQPPNRPLIDETLPKMERDLDLLDGAYGEREWLAGDSISLADLFVAPIVHTASQCPEGAAALQRCRNLARAFEAFSRRPSYIKALPAEFPSATSSASA
jgi:glutathione S-transferase